MQSLPESSATLWPHSGLGIAAFIISLYAGTLMLLTLVIAGAAAMQTGAPDDDPAAVVMLLFVVCVAIPAQVVALGLGIGGLLQAGRNRLFAILGVTFAGSALFTWLMLFLVGAAMPE